MYTTGTGSNAVTNWTNVWLVPAGIAAVVLLLFLVLFNEKKKVAEQV